MADSKLRMHQSIAGYMFEGPYSNFERIKSEMGLWAVITSDAREYYLVDVDYSRDVKNSLINNPREKCWNEFNRGQILYAFLSDGEIGEIEYKTILRQIRKNLKNIPCGN